MEGIQGDEILVRLFARENARLHNQQPPLLIVLMADRCHHHPYNFSQDHPYLLGK
jgi:hypothetical protein